MLFANFIIDRRCRSDFMLDPVCVFFIPQIIALVLLVVLSETNFLVPSKLMSATALMYYVLFNALFFTGVIISKSYFSINSSLREIRITTKYVTYCCYGTFIVGQVGSLYLLQGMGISNPISAISAFFTDFSRFEEDFFNSSFAILWQANIAFLFWFSLSNKNLLLKIMLFFCIMSLFFRGAYVYLIIGAFYFFVPYYLFRGYSKKLLLYLLISFLALNIITVLSYSFSSDSFYLLYFSKIYPYVPGNIVNFSYHADNSTTLYSFTEILSSLGFYSILLYINDYFSDGPLTAMTLPFYNQVQGHAIYGNTSMIFGKLLYAPILISALFIMMLGLLCGYFYERRRSNLFCISVLSFLTAASFLSFATGGHFGTTRFFPALLFIWPLLCFKELYRNVKI